MTVLMPCLLVRILARSGSVIDHCRLPGGFEASCAARRPVTHAGPAIRFAGPSAVAFVKCRISGNEKARPGNAKRRAYILGKSAKPQRADLAARENARISVIHQRNRCESQRVRDPAISGLQLVEKRPLDEAFLARPRNRSRGKRDGASGMGPRS